MADTPALVCTFSGFHSLPPPIASGRYLRFVRYALYSEEQIVAYERGGCWQYQGNWYPRLDIAGPLKITLSPAQKAPTTMTSGPYEKLWWENGVLFAPARQIAVLDDVARLWRDAGIYFGEILIEPA